MAVKKAPSPKKKSTDLGDDKAVKKGSIVSSKSKTKKVEEVEEKEISKAPIVIKKSAVKPAVAPAAAVAPAPVAPAATQAATPAKAKPAAAPAEKAAVKPAATPTPTPAKPKPVEPPRPSAPKHVPPAAPRRPIQPARPSFDRAKKMEAPPRSAPSKITAPVATAPESGSSSRKKVQFNEMMTVKDLASALDVKIPDLIKKLLALGKPATINQRLETDIATLLAAEFNAELDVKSIYEEAERPDKDDPAKLQQRSPVVTVMGHVDHGKTSLLDAIRSTQVASGEAGGITQHIGAYRVSTPKGTITFLDTPGHEAFSAMRARGAQATDLVILVVAADDSVMPQTIEAIDHARAADVPIVVAINKVDLPTANVQKVKQELSQHNLIAEDWGGKTVMVEVSAKTKKNLDKLLEMVLLETELLELKANPDRSAHGTVLEAKLDPRRGITATVLIQTGTLRVGDIVVCGLTSGRIRAMLDDRWQPLETAGPSTPVAILGLTQVPQVGDQLSVVKTDQEAREIAERRRQTTKDAAGKVGGHLSLEGLHTQIEEGKIQELKVILKADVQGSLQAILDSFGKLAGQPIQVKCVHSGVGNINESDILLAEAANAVVLGFNVKVEGSAESEAKKGGVDVRTYAIIYEMLADVKAAMEGLLKPEEREAVKGRALVKSVFPSGRSTRVAGVMVQEGKINRGSKARVVRDGRVIGSGSISSLKRFKEDAKEVEKGYECGIGIDGISDFQPNDIIEAYVIEKHARRLEA